MLFIIKAGMKTVWTLLENRLTNVVGYINDSHHFPCYTVLWYVYVMNSKENEELSGDSMKMHMFTLPIRVLRLDLIASKVSLHICCMDLIAEVLF